MNSFNECSLESDYEKYLKGLLIHQEEIESIPLKCTEAIWTHTQFEDFAVESNTSIVLDMIITEGQVCIKFNNSRLKGSVWSTLYFQITVEREAYIYSTEYFVSAIGGFLGLFLGGSILGIVKCLESYFSWYCMKHE